MYIATFTIIKSTVPVIENSLFLAFISSTLHGVDLSPVLCPQPSLSVPNDVACTGKPITRPAAVAPAPVAAAVESEKGEKKLFPVHTLESLEKLNDAELYSIFHQGVADIPSALPNQLGAPEFTLVCSSTLSFLAMCAVVLLLASACVSFLGTK
jgi:hypothetical protein